MNKNLERIKKLIDYEDGVETLKDFFLDKENIKYVPMDKGKKLFLDINKSLTEFVEFINILSIDTNKEEDQEDQMDFPQIVMKELENFNGEHISTIIENYMPIDEINSFTEFKTILNEKYLEYLDDLQPKEYYKIMEIVDERELIFKSIKKIKNELKDDFVEHKTVFTIFSDLIYKQNKKEVEKEVTEFIDELKVTLNK